MALSIPAWFRYPDPRLDRIAAHCLFRSHRTGVIIKRDFVRLS